MEIEDGTVRCQKCADKNKRIPRAPDYDKPIGFFLLSEQEVRDLKNRIQSLQEYFDKHKGREPVLLDKEKQQTRQSKF